MSKQTKLAELPLWMALDLLFDKAKAGIQAEGSKAFADGKFAQAEKFLERWRETDEVQKKLKTLRGQMHDVVSKSDIRQIEEFFATESDTALTTTPEPAPETAPEADEFEEAVAAEKPTKKTQSQRLLRQQKVTVGNVDVLLSMHDWDEHRIALSKGLTCRLRALIIETDEAGLDSSELYNAFYDLRDRFESERPEIRFYGFSTRREHPASLWNEVADAYEALGWAADAIEWIETDPEIDDQRFEDLMRAIAAAEAWLYRLFGEHSMKAGDDQQRDINMRVKEAVAGAFYVPWWNMDPEHKVETRDIADEANRLKGLFETIKSSVEKSHSKETAKQALDDVLETDDAHEDFAHSLEEAIARALDAGVPPSDKTLRERVAPYRAYLKDTEHGQVKRLFNYLSKDATTALAKGTAVVEEPEDADRDSLSDPDFAPILKEVQKRLKGKTLLFIGGNKGQGWRIQEYKKALGIKDLIWPDAEDTTRPGMLASDISKCDVAVLLIRWSRHSYKSVLDEAKEAGKETVTLTRGLGIKTFVQAYYDQLVQTAPVSNSA